MENQQGLFCQFSNQLDCLDLQLTKGVCQLVDKQCTHFTGCEAFDLTTDNECQEISKQCIINESYCIELDSCEKYEIKSSCLISITGKQCYWNDEQKTCTNVSQCNQISKSVLSDDQCRIQIKTCTVKAGGGCQDSGVLCQDQKLEIQCQYDLNQTQQCFWQDNSCHDKICQNAPKNYIADNQQEVFVFGIVKYNSVILSTQILVRISYSNLFKYYKFLIYDEYELSTLVESVNKQCQEPYELILIAIIKQLENQQLEIKQPIIYDSAENYQNVLHQYRSWKVQIQNIIELISQFIIEIKEQFNFETQQQNQILKDVDNDKRNNQSKQNKPLFKSNLIMLLESSDLMIVKNIQTTIKRTKNRCVII